MTEAVISVDEAVEVNRDTRLLVSGECSVRDLQPCPAVGDGPNGLPPIGPPIKSNGIERLFEPGAWETALGVLGSGRAAWTTGLRCARPAMSASDVRLSKVTPALRVHRWRRAGHRLFAFLVSFAVSVSFFSAVAWAATEIPPLPLASTLVGTLTLLFALRSYRQSPVLPLNGPIERARVYSNRAKLAASGDERHSLFSFKLGRQEVCCRLNASVLTAEDGAGHV